jgi:hypothetical protein
MSPALDAHLQKLSTPQRNQITDTVIQLAQELLIHNPELNPAQAFILAEAFYFTRLNWLIQKSEPATNLK